MGFGAGVLPLLCLVSVVYGGSFTDITLEGCGTVKGCLGPAICTDSSCAFFATWKLVNHNGESYVEFELKGHMRKPGGFISLAFSKDRKVVSFITSRHHFKGMQFVAVPRRIPSAI